MKEAFSVEVSIARHVFFKSLANFLFWIVVNISTVEMLYVVRNSSSNFCKIILTSSSDVLYLRSQKKKSIRRILTAFGSRVSESWSGLVCFGTYGDFLLPWRTFDIEWNSLCFCSWVSSFDLYRSYWGLYLTSMSSKITQGATLHAGWSTPETIWFYPSGRSFSRTFGKPGKIREKSGKGNFVKESTEIIHINVVVISQTQTTGWWLEGILDKRLSFF